uniref:Uncharacterized protein n=1 Tax=Arundo donax TaxID=35708 RepID=A0A0A9GBL3_ARUDO
MDNSWMFSIWHMFLIWWINILHFLF